MYNSVFSMVYSFFLDTAKYTLSEMMRWRNKPVCPPTAGKPAGKKIKAYSPDSYRDWNRAERKENARHYSTFCIRCFRRKHQN